MLNYQRVIIHWFLIIFTSNGNFRRLYAHFWTDPPWLPLAVGYVGEKTISEWPVRISRTKLHISKVERTVGSSFEVDLSRLSLYLSIYAHRIAILERSSRHNHEEPPNSCCQVMQRVECRRHHSGRGDHPEMFGAKLCMDMSGMTRFAGFFGRDPLFF